MLSDSDLLPLKNVHGDTDLSLRNTQVTDEGVRYLSGLESVRAINVSDTKVSDNAIQAFYQVRGYHWTPEGLTPLDPKKPFNRRSMAE
jgi:hypothetical protein